MIPIRNAVPSRYPPVVTWMLIAINCLVFLFQDSLGPDELELFLRQFALIPARYSEAFASGETDLDAADILPFFSMMFLHGGWLHLILNMWTLWLFGPTVEDRMGHARYLAFYLACGLAASVAHRNIGWRNFILIDKLADLCVSGVDHRLGRVGFNPFYFLAIRPFGDDIGPVIVNACGVVDRQRVPEIASKSDGDEPQFLVTFSIRIDALIAVGEYAQSSIRH
ncbi:MULTISPECIES: rhomboid family intramembrane serine protease [Bradyrhizobium]|jgi:membrane associated rhomboid family serine protease|uniref:Rhomboid family protein n=2 Tax=Bradyrhizobium TaxID=374 RepID=A0ABY0P8Z6_9BRAD|nr:MULTISPECIES: rhomboid family intramembrane serine protease [Bradyrhizobium]SDH64158.1 Rhomboid family protein [Bradyrhizobium ottawaense]SEE18149.1 Rhomboid family protein [Bradyrhizobium lablabi]SHM14141.1 Rhomboid family protein [Bradyrhizobium lablabi]